VFTITVTDDDGGTDTQAVTINIAGSNDAPVITAGVVTGTITEDGTVSEAGSITFTDLDLTDTPTATEATASITTALTLTGAQQAAIENAFTISADAGNANDGTINWDYTITEGELDFLANGETVTAVFTITVDDGNLGTATQDVTINIIGANDAPVVSNVAAAATEDGVTVNGSFVVSDVDTTDTHTFTITSSPSEGSVVNNNNGTFTFDPGAAFQDLALGETRDVTFNYTATDDSGTGNATSTPATITVTITGTNDTPTVSDVAVNAIEDGATVDGSFVVSDADTTDTHTFNITSSPSEGSVVNNNDGTFTFDPGTDFQDLTQGQTRDVTFTYTSTDENGAGSTTATVTVTVTGASDTVALPEEAPGSTQDPTPDPGDGKVTSDPVDLVATDIETDPAQERVDSFTLNKVNKSPVPTDTILTATDDDYSIYGALRQDINIERHDISSLELWQMIDIMKEQINNSGRGDDGYMNLFAKSASGLALSLSAGVVTWALQGSSILASMLSSVPLLKGFDPLPIIAKSKKSEDDESEDTSNALNDEQNAARLLDTTRTSAGENNGHD